MIVNVEGHIITVTVGDQELELGFPEANDLQAKLRQVLVDHHVTMRDAV